MDHSDAPEPQTRRISVADWYDTDRKGRSVIVLSYREGMETIVAIGPMGDPNAPAVCYQIHGTPAHGTVGPLPSLPDVPPGAAVGWREGVIRWVDLLSDQYAEAVQVGKRRLMCLSTETLFDLNERPDGSVSMDETCDHP